MAVCQNLVPLVNIKIAGKWMFIPLKMVLIGIDPYPYGKKTHGKAVDKKHGKLMKHVSHIWPTTTFQSAFDPPQATRGSLGKIPVDRRLRCLTFNYDDNCGLGRYRRTAVDVDDQVPFILCFFLVDQLTPWLFLMAEPPSIPLHLLVEA